MLKLLQKQMAVRSMAGDFIHTPVEHPASKMAAEMGDVQGGVELGWKSGACKECKGG